MEKAIIVFEKNKILGKVKTRLAATVGDEKALELYSEMVRYTHEIIEQGEQVNFIYYSDFLPTDHSANFQHGLQHGVDLGDRMMNALIDIKAKGFKKVVLIGTDCLELTNDIISFGFDMLDLNDIVIGPATDGGYYLIGMNQIYIELFENMEWSTSHVLTETLNRCAELKLSVGVLPALNDIDEEGDLGS